MDVRYHIDPHNGLPHCYGHGVTEEEAEQVLVGPGETVKGDNASRIKVGQTAAGRYLKVIYVPDDDGAGVFIVTAYELRGNAKQSYRRRRRKRGK
jgi:hypothetical protein